jgi:hypothetical protein
MARVIDFKTKYEEAIFAIDPAFSQQGHCGWAIINTNAAIFGGIENKPFIKSCGIIQPFSSESSLRTMNDLCKKLVEIWRNEAGYSREPSAIIVERPVIYPGSPVRFSSIEKLNIFVGMILKSLSPKIQLSPSPNEWKGNQKKEDTENKIISMLSFNDRTVLERDLKNIKVPHRHNLFDALGLGIYAAHVLNKKIAPPNMIHLDEDAKFYASL